MFGDHNGVEAGSGNTTFLVIELMGSDVMFVNGSNKTTACGTSGLKPKFYFNSSRVSTPHLYDPRNPLSASIEPCPYRWLKPKCSRTVNFMGFNYTANRGYPPCNGGGQDADSQQTVAPSFEAAHDATPRTTVSGATFRIRIYGKPAPTTSINRTAPSSARADGGTVNSGLTCGRAHQHGYTATFAPGAGCGPAKWPTGALRGAYNNGDSRFPPYAEWCEFTVTAN